MTKGTRADPSSMIEVIVEVEATILTINHYPSQTPIQIQEMLLTPNSYTNANKNNTNIIMPLVVISRNRLGVYCVQEGLLSL